MRSGKYLSSGVLLSLIAWSAPLAVLAGAAAPRPQAAPAQAASAPAVVVAFVGGIFHHKVEHYRMFAEQIRREYGQQVRVEVVFNAADDRKKAARAVHHWLDTDGDGMLSVAEKRDARIILYGHSYGASAELVFARSLQQENIPILLLIRVDGVAKPGRIGANRLIPGNVAQAINFYQHHGVIRGQAEIAAEDPEHTQILGNIQVPFDPEAAKSCKDYSALLRTIDKYHIAIECDTNVWTQIHALIRTSLSAPAAAVQTSRNSPAAP